VEIIGNSKNFKPISNCKSDCAKFQLTNDKSW